MRRGSYKRPSRNAIAFVALVCATTMCGCALPRIVRDDIDQHIHKQALEVMRSATGQEVLRDMTRSEVSEIVNETIGNMIIKFAPWLLGPAGAGIAFDQWRKRKNGNAKPEAKA